MDMLDWCCLTAHHRMISREAGLNDTTSKCTGVPSYEDCIEHVDVIVGVAVVKGNRNRCSSLYR